MDYDFIQYGVEDAIKEAEENEWICIPDPDSRSALEEEAIEYIRFHSENDDDSVYKIRWNPDFSAIVLDIAQDYGFVTI